MFIQYTLQLWNIGQLIDDASFVLSELVTNAVQSTGISDAQFRWTELTDLALIKVRLLLTDTNVFIEVWDRDPMPPLITAERCTRWNYYQPREGGKVVWGELEIPPYPLTPSGLPKRQPIPEPPTRAEVMHDPELLRRVRDQLRCWCDE